MKWIKASERLPDREAEYFIKIDDYRAVGIFADGFFWADDKKLHADYWLDETVNEVQWGIKTWELPANEMHLKPATNLNKKNKDLENWGILKNKYGIE